MCIKVVLMFCFMLPKSLAENLDYASNAFLLKINSSEQLN